MTLADFVPGDDTFVDANIFVYHFAVNPVLQPISSQFLQRIENQEIRGYTSLHILSDVAHRLLTMEAQAQHRWSSGKLIQRLKQNPAVFQTFTRFRTAIERITQSRVAVLSSTPALMVTATQICQQSGLLITDALTVALMQANNLAKIASDDSDFDRIPGLTRYAPV